MSIRRPLAILVLLGTAAHAAQLPLKPGTYVIASTPCKDPPFAAMFSYDGRQFTYPHASDCHSKIVSQHGRAYRVEEMCAALGDGSHAAPTNATSIYIVESATHLRIMKNEERRTLHYRWCPSN